MNQFGYSPSFVKALERLGRQEQAAVTLALLQFQNNPEAPGHRLHPLGTKEKRFHSISANMDLRLILLKEKGQFFALYVDHHDKAYEWAQRRKVEVHPTTRAAQIVEFEEVIREEVRTVHRTVEAPLFAGEADDYLLALGVPPAWLPTVRQVDADGLYRILDRLPEEAAEALIALYDGERPVPRPAAPQDEAGEDGNPFTHPDALRRFWVAADEQALRQALDYPWDRWTVFLHPSQRDAVTRNFGGPCRVSGSAGTGKTVVALHRAVHLARRSPEARVLLTTYAQPLVNHLQEALDRLVGTTGDVRRRIHVTHLHRYAHGLLREAPGPAPVPVRPADLEAFIDRALAEHGDDTLSRAFVKAEFDAVIDYWGIRDADAYRRVRRTGRGTPLSPERRATLWPVFASLREQMTQAGRATWADIADAGRRHLEARGNPPFEHVVADEAQDFGPQELRLLMALAPPGPLGHFFTGDVGQRIYRYPFPWLRAGVDIRGRGALLTVNYRTTRQIRSFADRTLGIPQHDEDEDPPRRDAVSLLSGLEPEVVACAGSGEEIAGLAQWLGDLIAGGAAPEELAVFARTMTILEDVAAPAVERAGLVPRLLTATDTGPAAGRVAVGTLHAAKGLEFRAVAIVGCGGDALPHPAVLAAADTPEMEEIARARERQLLYVGLTRARDVLRISYTGTPSAFLLP